MKILFLSRSLEMGGAERQLTTLANGLRRKGHRCAIAVFYSGGELESSLDDIQLIDLKKKGRWDFISFSRRLIKAVQDFNPDIIHGYLGTPNLLVSMLRPLFPKAKTVWGVRASFMDLSQYGLPERIHYQLERFASNTPHSIIINSQAGKDYAISQRFPEAKITVIRNGIDTSQYFPDKALAKSIRKEWGIEKTAILVGLVGRIDPIKNHFLFLEVVNMLQKHNLELRFVCVGDGPEEHKNALQQHASALGISNKIRWTGKRSDISAIYNALDICCSTSNGEGFPNVLAEAMACGTPCVATNVGDSKEILGQHGQIVPPGDPIAFANAITMLATKLNQPDIQIESAVRTRITTSFSVEQMISTTEEHLHDLLHQ